MRSRPIVWLAILTGAAGLPRAGADVEVSASQAPASVSVTVYGSADLAVVREVRRVVLEAGRPTDVVLAWPRAAVDPSSVRVSVPEGVRASAASQPARKTDRVVWRLEAAEAGERQIEVSYFTSGLDWRPYYRLALNEGTGGLELEGLVRLHNRSGQEFRAASVRLVVGEIPLLTDPTEASRGRRDEKREAPPSAGSGLSERYVYDLGTVPRLTLDDTYVLPFVPRTSIRTQVTHRLHPAKYGDPVHEVLVFVNSREVGLGAAPLAKAEAFLSEVTAGGLIPRGRVTVPYTPIGEKCEIDLGVSRDIVAERRVIERRRTSFEFDRFDAVEGYDDRQEVELEVSNWSLQRATVECTDTVPGVWEVTSDEPYTEEKLNEVVFRFDLEPQATKLLHYRLLQRQGKRVRLGPVR